MGLEGADLGELEFALQVGRHQLRRWTALLGRRRERSASRPSEKHDRGIFRCAPADLADPTKHTLLFDAEFEMANMIIEDGVILAGHCAPASTYKTGIAISPDMGKTWAQYDLAEFGPRSPVRFQPKNSDGWFRVDLRKGWIERAEVLFIKPKP